MLVSGHVGRRHGDDVGLLALGILGLEGGRDGGREGGRG